MWGAGPEVELSRAGHGIDGHGIDGKPDSFSKWQHAVINEDWHRTVGIQTVNVKDFRGIKRRTL